MEAVYQIKYHLTENKIFKNIPYLKKGLEIHAVCYILPTNYKLVVRILLQFSEQWHIERTNYVKI